VKFFSAIGHFFSSLFGGAGSTIQKVLHGVSSFVNLAEPIVAELAVIGSAIPGQPALLTTIETWLKKYTQNEPAITAWLASAQTLSTADILRTAATTALSALVPAGTLASDLNLAVELAYSAYKATRPAPTPPVAPAPNAAPAALVPQPT
jgi:hypothetical protein